MSHFVQSVFQSGQARFRPASALGTLFCLLTLSGCLPQSPPQASGTLARDRISLTATRNEIIQSLPVAEGAAVKRGEVLVVFSTQAQQIELRQALASRDQAKAALAKLRNGERVEDIEAAKANLENAQVKLTDAKRNYQRIAALAKKKLVAQSEKDNALADRDAAQASFDAANQQWKKAAQGYRQEDIDEAKANLAAAQAAVDLQRYRLSELTIVATRDGILDALPYNLGERVPANQVVAIIQANTRPYSRVYLPEPYLAKFPVGTRVTVHIDGMPQSVTGTIRWISVEPAFTPYRSMNQADRSRFVYLTKIDLPETTRHLPSGIPLEVDLGE